MSSIPVLVKILIIFVAVIFASARKIHLGLAAALGGICLALWSGLSFKATLGIALLEVINPDTILLIVLMAYIMAFSAAMKKSGIMDELASSLQLVTSSPRFAMALAPLLIGTLPMPGGAVLSAPLVDSMDKQRKRSPAVLSTANYWFRHILELAWPLYPAFILTSSISGIKSSRLILLNSYAPPLLFVIGLLFILPSERKGKNHTKKLLPETSFKERFGSLFAGIKPLAVAIGTYVVLDIIWKNIAPSLFMHEAVKTLTGRYGPIYIGLSLGSFFILKSKNGKGSFRQSINTATWRLIAVIIGIRVFSVLLGKAGLAQAAAEELARAGIPTVIAVAILPFVAGMVTGIGFGYVGLAFPIVIGLSSVVSSMPFEALMVLAGAFGYAGMMLSPLHVCMVVSAEHFGVGLASVMKRFVPALGLFAVLASGYAILLSLLLR